MGRQERLLLKIQKGSSDTDIRFAELCQLLAGLGFSQRVRGSHHIFFKDGVDEILNLQPRGSKAKAYQVKQVKQVRNVILKYRLGGSVDE